MRSCVPANVGVWDSSECGRSGGVAAGRLHTATPVINRGKWWSPAALSEFRSLILNGMQRSVNRKVQGSNPCPGAKSVRISASSQLFVDLYAAVVQRRHSNIGST